MPVGDAPPSARHRGGIGRGDDGMNLIEGNDFTQAAITTNTGFREGFPVDKQAWPPDYYPSVDDPL